MSDFLKGGVGYSKERASEVYTLSYNKQKALLAQEIYGTVLVNGKPISNAEINRRLGIGTTPTDSGQGTLVGTVKGGARVYKGN